MRVLLWVQHLLGTGHLSRALVIARALAGRGLEVTVASGGPPLVWLPVEGVDLVQLPAIRSLDVAFSALVDETGRPVDETFWQARREALLALFERLRPSVLITEMFPFGRRAFRGELLPLLERAGRAGTWRLASVRDVLVEKPDASRYAWMRDAALQHYDRILVHTDPSVIPFSLTFPFTGALGERLVSTGYLAPGPVHGEGGAGAGEILVSAGGGAVGRKLLEAAAGARPLVRHTGAPWRLIGASDAGLPRPPLPGVILDDQRPDFRVLLANSLLSISQAGYNTVVEALACRKRMILVPFESTAETEQRTRAGRLAELGLAEVIWERQLSAIRLAETVDAILMSSRTRLPAVDLGGAERTAAVVAALAAAGPAR
jgi:predicted glycosyltransferase